VKEMFLTAKLLCGAVILFLFFPVAVIAASISFTPHSGTFKVGDTFPVSIVVSSVDQEMNAAGGHIIFPPSKLKVTDISYGSSILKLWVQEPSYSNTAGTIDL
jgi:hypothetical protein